MQCQHCSESFSSRNLLFKHLRQSKCGEKSGVAPKEGHVALQIAYYRREGLGSQSDIDDFLAQALKLPKSSRGFFRAARFPGKSRACSFQSGISALGEVVSYIGPKLGTSLARELFLSEVNAHLAERNGPLRMRVIRRTEIPNMGRLHFDPRQRCTAQRVEVYLPWNVLEPLGGAFDIERLRRILKLFDAPVGASGSKTSRASKQDGAQPEGVEDNKYEKEPRSPQAGDKRSWHSFSTISTSETATEDSGNLDKPLCPMDERCMLWFRRLRFGAKHPRFLRLIMQSDRFLRGMPRVIAGIVVAIYRGFIRPEQIELFTNEEIVDFGPVLPPFLEVLAECKYSLWEVRVTSPPGRKKSDASCEQRRPTDVDGVVDAIRAGDTAGEARCHEFRTELEENIWNRLVEIDHLRAWAYELGRFWAAYRQARRSSTEIAKPERILPSERAPRLYLKALLALQHVVQCGLWPGSGSRRSKLLLRESNVDHMELRPGPSSTFSIGIPPPGQPVPKGNTDLPLLCQAIFELEEGLISSLGLRRKRSAMCAVNRNARFMPHVDAGSGGVGQGTSLIVGLGNYAGGEIVVEGEAHDIRYIPLEFNGWTQRHWTRPFIGERFSLVYFTPRGCEDRTWKLAEDPNKGW